MPPRLTIARAARLFRSAQLTSQELCTHSRNLALFGENSLGLNAYAKVLPLHQIIEQARASDARLQNGTPKSLLDGIPVTIKANIAVGRYWEMPNACSAILRGGGQSHDPNSESVEDLISSDCVYESDIARILLNECGAVIVGITNMDEFGMGSLGINNGLSNHPSMQQLSTQQQNQYAPTYNPIPWMNRLSSLIDSRHTSLDDYWLQLVRNSSLENPHGIDDEGALANLLDEVQHWVCGRTGEQMSHGSDSGASPLLSPGGSSSGAAASAAHGSCLLSIGTDTGGSLRLPSAWTSTVGFKPSYGTFSRYGVVSYASSLDTVGFITATTECAEIAWRCLSSRTNDARSDGTGKTAWNGSLCRDSTARAYHRTEKVSDEEAVDNCIALSAKPLANLRVGIPSAFSLKELPPQIADAWSDSANHLHNVGGATLVPISESSLPSRWIKLSLASYYVLACAEASSNLSRYDGVRYGMDLDDSCASIDAVDKTAFGPLSDMTALEQQISATRAYGFGEEIQRRVLAGTSVLSSDRFHTHYEAAAVVRAKLSRSLDERFRSSLDDETDDKVDVMLVPTVLSLPCKLNPLQGAADGKSGRAIDPTAAFANDVMTIPISLGGLPSISVPVVPVKGWSNQIGMQIFSSRGSEDLVLSVADTLTIR